MICEQKLQLHFLFYIALQNVKFRLNIEKIEVKSVYLDKPVLRPVLHSVGLTPESSPGCFILLLAKRNTQRDWLYQSLEMRLVSSNLINWLNFNSAHFGNQIKVNTLTERNTKHSKDDLLWQRIHLTKKLLTLCSVSKAADVFSSIATRCLSCSRGGEVCQRCIICNACMSVCICTFMLMQIRCLQSLFLRFP